jgi:hypothetical protein
MRGLALSWLFLCVITLPTWAADKRSSQDCRLQQLASLQLAVADQIWVPVDYRGRALWMALDLGSPFSLISPAAVERLSLSTTRLDARPEEFWMSIGGNSVAASAEVDALKLGDYRIPRRSFFVDPRPAAAAAETERMVLGTLGMRELRAVDFELDLAHQRLNLYSPKHCAGAVTKVWEHATQIPMDLNEFGSVLFPVDVDGSKLVASISTTSGESEMHLDVSRRVFGLDEHSPRWQERVDAEHRRRGYYRSVQVTAGDLKLPNVEVRLVPGLAACALSQTGLFGEVWEYQGRDGHLCFAAYPLVLGRPAIEHLKLYFATGEKMIYVEAVAPVPLPGSRGHRESVAVARGAATGHDPEASKRKGAS